MEQKHLAIATVPVQSFGPLFEEKEALRIGTIFKDLDKPFFAADRIPENGPRDVMPKSAEQQEREKLMSQVLEVSFVLDDLTLYLDTHEEDGKALALYREKEKERNQLKQEFAEKFYPLTRDCLIYCKEETRFGWQAGPMPWEGACI